jgi:hypothetical protein
MYFNSLKKILVKNVKIVLLPLQKYRITVTVYFNCIAKIFALSFGNQMKPVMDFVSDMQNYESKIRWCT